MNTTKIQRKPFTEAQRELARQVLAMSEDEYRAAMEQEAGR